MEQANDSRKLYTIIRKRQTFFVCHIINCKALEIMRVTGMINDRRGRRIPEEIMLEGCRCRHGGIPSIKLTQKTWDLDLQSA